MKLRPYQQNQVEEIRHILAKNRTGMVQLATGGGKTAIFSAITQMASAKDKKVWIVAPRNELVKQAGNHLRIMKVPHGIISASSSESRAYGTHVASRDTLIRRVKDDKIKNIPDIVIFDEAHIALDTQIKIAEYLPESTKIIGFTATPERLDGRGLSELYSDMSSGPTIGWLQENEYLAPDRYFCPPSGGIRDLKRKGTEYDEKEVEAFLKGRHVYGDAVGHYHDLADKETALIYCRSIKASHEVAEKFNDYGYKFLALDGKMSVKERAKRIGLLESGEIHGLASCELITFGLDVPRVKYIGMLRPTLSRALFMQMFGRGARIHPGKTHFICCDHVDNIKEHGHPAGDIDWNFYGKDKRKKGKGEDIAAASICSSCFRYFVGEKCPHCNKEKDHKATAGLVEVEGRLVEQIGPIKLRDRPDSERSELMNKKSEMITNKDVAGLLGMASDLGNKPMWAYHSIVDGGPLDIELIKEIARINNYKSGWVKLTVKQLGR